MELQSESLPETDTTDTSVNAAAAAAAPTGISQQCVGTFNKTVLEFVDELKATFPELEDIVNERYASLSDSDDSVMKWFELNAKEHHMALTTKDDTLFKTNSALFLLPDINFSQLWKCKVTKANKSAVWKYLHVLLLLVSHNKMSTVSPTVWSDTHPTTPTTASTPGDENTNALDMQKMFEQWNTMLDDKELDAEQLQTMKEQSANVMRLMESLNQPTETDDADVPPEQGGGGSGSQKSGENPFAGMENDPFLKQLENSKIAQFAKELSTELDMKDLGLSEEDANINSFQDVFGMMGKNPQKLMGLVKTVGDKIQTKMQSGDIQQTELVSEAQNLMQSMTSSDVFKNMFKGKKGGGGGGGGGAGGLDPAALFQNLAKTMNLDPNQFDPAMMQNMMSQMQQGSGGLDGLLNPRAGGGDTRARLQQKLARQQMPPHAPPEDAACGVGHPTAATGTAPKKKKNKKKKNKKTTHTPAPDTTS